VASRAADVGLAAGFVPRKMSSFASDPAPLDIDDVQHLRETAGEIRLRVSGRWRGETAPSDAQSALLVIQIEGRRHRFAPVHAPGASAQGRWTASFVVPGWAEPRREGQAALWIGEAVVPIPPSGAARRWPGSRPPALRSAVPADLPDPPDEPEPANDRTPVEPTSEPPRSGPLAEMLLKETVAALHAELESRGVEAAQLRSALTGAQSELQARTESQSALEGTLGELGAELRRLTAAVDQQRCALERREADGAREREEFARRLTEISVARDDQAAELTAVRDELVSAREELAAAQVAREAARGEAAGLRAELERLGSELAVTREHLASQTGDLGEANRLLADARALAEQLRSPTNR